MLLSLYVPLLLASGAFAAPTASTELARRGTAFNIGEIIADIIELKNHKVNAWDPNLKNTCVLEIQTTAGGGCQAQIGCGTDIGQGRFKLADVDPGNPTDRFAWNVSRALLFSNHIQPIDMEL
jgi:hypothetical protein